MMTPADKPTSLTLLERVRGRDEEAWRRLLHLYGPLVDRWSRYRRVRGEDLDDVRQEVFQAVAADLDRFRRDRPGDTFRGWLRVIAGHKILDHFRRRQKLPEAQGGSDAHQRIQQIAEQELPDETEDDIGDLYLRPWKWSAASSSRRLGRPFGGARWTATLRPISPPTWE